MINEALDLFMEDKIAKARASLVRAGEEEVASDLKAAQAVWYTLKFVKAQLVKEGLVNE